MKAWGIFIALIGFIGWIGQVLTIVSPQLAVKLGMAEPASEVDPVFLTDFKAEALWDIFILWNLPVAGVLLAFNNPLWIYFGLFGGSTYLYFSGRNIIQRISLNRKGIRIGTAQNIKLAYIFCFLWGVSGAVTIGLAISSLHQRF